MSKKLLTFAIIFFIIFTGIAQVGIGTTSPDASSALDITATDKGFLMPRMTTVQKDAIASPATGLQVYDTETKSVWTYDGIMWQEGSGGAGKFVDGATPDIAYYAGKVGIGRDAFSDAHKLWVEGNKDTDGTNTAAKIVANYEGTGTSTATYGLAVESNNKSSGIVTSASGTLSAVTNSANGTLTTGISSWGYITNNGNIGYGAGAYGVIYNQAGTINYGLGTIGAIENYAGAHIGSAFAGDFYTTNQGTIDNLYGAFFEYGGAGTVTNSYAIYIDDTFNKGLTENFAIYSESDADSYLEGNVGFGIDAPLQKVHIDGVMRLEPQASAPTGGALGDLYVSSADNKLYFHNGTEWKEVQLVP